MKNSRKIVEHELYQSIESEQDEQSKAIEDVVSQIRGTSDLLAANCGTTYEHLTPDIYNKILTNLLKQHPQLRSIGVWYEPYIPNKNEKYERYFAQYINGDYITYKKYNSNNFDYLNYPLYTEAKQLNKPFFSEAHYHDLLDTYTITYVTPIQNAEGEFIGGVSASFDISKLKTLVDKYNNEFFNFYILDDSGTYIAHTDLELIKSQANIIDCNDDFTENAETILGTNSGILTHVKDGKEYYIYYNTVTEFNWKLVYEVPRDYISQPLLRLTLVNTVISFISILILIILIIYVTIKFVHKPLQLLLVEFKNISSGNYSSDIPPKLLATDTEFSDIGIVLEEMKLNLTDYQSRLKYKNQLLISNEKTLQETVDYINAIIGALPIMMFVFDRNARCLELHGKTHFSNRPKEFYIGKDYIDLIDEDAENCPGLKEFLHTVKTIKYDDGVVYKKISPIINGNVEHFEHNITWCNDDIIISLCRRITDTVNHIQDIEYLSEFDELTGLYNSRYFIDMIQEHIEHSSLPISVIVCDVNGFKSINDKYGFDEGDQLLVDLTVALNDIDVENKTVSRVAGDEFAVVLPNTTKVDAEKIIEKVNAKCLLGKVSKIPFSIGYGVDTKTSKEGSLIQLIKSVEALLYKQKIYTSSGLKDNSIGLINNILHAKSKRERLHSDRVSELCLEMAQALGWSQLEQNKLRTAGLLHDIGKIGISEAILNKPGALTDEEYKEMCTHPEIGFKILQSFENMKELAEYAYAHHEKWDGTGYPRRLKGTEIPIESRILAIIDTFDAMTSRRSYRDGLPKEVAITELIRCKHTQFDPELVDIFIEKVLNERLEDFQD